MKKFKEFLKEQPTNSVGNGGYTGSGGANVAGYDKRLFPTYIDDLDQGYQTPGESGLAKWRFSNVWPVMKVTLDNSLGDGPSIDSMVAASKEFVNIEAAKTAATIRKTFARFMGSR